VAVAISWTPRSAMVRPRAPRPRADLIDDHDFGHVVLHRLDHGGVLALRRRHLHPPCPTDARVGDVAVAGNLVGCVDDDDALVQSSASTRAASRSRVVLPTPGRPAAGRCAGLDDIADDVDGSVDRPSDAAGQTTISPTRLRKAEIRCNVRSMPARLSRVKVPMRAVM